MTDLSDRFAPDTISLGDERDRLATEYDRSESELGELQGRLADADDGADVDGLRERARRKRRYLSDLEQMGQAVGGLIERYGADATVTVRGLSAVEYAEVENRTTDAAATATTGAGVPGTGRLIFAAHGLVDAPFLGDADTLEAKLEAFQNLSIGERKWVEDLVDERTVVGQKNWRDSASDGPESQSP